MAAASVLPAMNGDGGMSIHPFFRQTNSLQQHTDDRAATEHAKSSAMEQSEQLDGACDEPQKAKKKRKSNGPAQGDAKGKKQKTLQQIVNPKATELQQQASGDHVNSTEIIGLVSSDPVVDRSYRKRRRAGEIQAIDVDSRVIANSTDSVVPWSSPRVVIQASSPRPDDTGPIETQADHETAKVPQTPPKKVLKLTANGKFPSPISKKSKQDDGAQASPGAPKRRGRPRKVKDAVEPRRLVVKIGYGVDEARRSALAQRIDRVLAGEEMVAMEQKKATPRKQRTPRKPAKATHPFFMGKKDAPPAPKQESPRKASATTPGKLRRQVFGDRLPAVPAVPEVPHAVESALLKDRHMVKHPGAKEPAWPDKEQAHVRGLDESEKLRDTLTQPASGLVKQRKRKAARLPFPAVESVLRHFASTLVPEPDRVERDDGFYEPHPCLRIPEKLLISGHDIRQRIAPELSVELYHDADDELSLPTSSQLSTHPNLQKLWRSIPTSLTGFDKGRGETLSWTQKYAPTAAAEVLQPSREMSVFRDWLTSLTVTAVESTNAHPLKHTPKAEAKPKKKRRRKPEDLDDFLVDSDEDVHNMDELTDPEDIASVTGSKTQKSLVHVAVDGAKLSNAVLLSGPHGCGKTAAAYAVAKELGFKVFEIGSHERRSGKDVLDKVGDMTENHLVKHHGVDAGELSSTEEPNKARLDEAFQRDLASGRQGKMNAFLKAKAQPKPVAPKQKASNKAKTLEVVQKAIKKPPKDQQQSLILLEEVDILFKDDKDFWNTVLKLILSSKRPFIMTCNDEDLVPLQVMSLHAILRFSPPPLDLATDYMLLMAAAEGHILKREAVESLFEHKHRDLRSSIAELDLWCQMGIGDPRGGLSWIYQRWPPGLDVDQYGRKLRVVSEGTYQSGMGLLPSSDLDDEARLLFAWQEYGIKPSSLPPSQLQVPTTHAELTFAALDDLQRLAALKEYGRFVEVSSCMDVYTKPGLQETAPLDTTQPDMPDKARNHYIEGMRLLQTDEMINHSAMGMELVIATTCLMSRIAYSENDDRNRLARIAPSLDNLKSSILTRKGIETTSNLTRHDFACFDAISVAPESALSTISGLAQSIFDGPLAPIATDMAPYVRSIVQYDIALEEQRERLNGLLADGDRRKAKRARTTRAARSALEGSQRGSTRRERWLTKALDMPAVLATGGFEWPKAAVSVSEATSVEDFELSPSSAEPG